MKKIITLIVLALTTNAFSQINFQSVNQTSVGLSGTNALLAIIDYNNDDNEDLIMSDNSQNLLFYKNNGNGTFTSLNIGINQNVNAGAIKPADFNNDGYQDFVITFKDSIKFFQNTTLGGFTDATSSLGFVNPITTRPIFFSANCGVWDDYDADGDLDLLINTKDNSNSYIEVFVNNLTSFNTRNILLTFTLPIQPLFTLIDYDNDQDQDVLLLNFNDNNPPMSQYYYQPLKLYQKSGTTYTDVTATSGLGLGSNHGFAQVWDYNNDGWADIIIGSTDNVFNSTNANRVYKNLGTGSFTDVSSTLNLMNGNNYYRFVYPTELDNDGDLDVLFASTNHLFSNNNNGTFTTDLISTSGLPSTSNYGSFMDYDNDGKLDFLSQVFSQNVGVYKNNTSNSNNYINVKLHGCPELKDSKGSRVCLYSSQGIQTRYFGNNKGGNGALDQVSNILHFGIGTLTTVDSIKVFWANGGITKHIPTINAMNHLYQLPSCNPLNNQNVCTSIGQDSLMLLNNGYITGNNPCGQGIHTETKWIKVTGADSLHVNTFQHRLYDASRIYDKNNSLIWQWNGENQSATWYVRNHSVYVGGNDSVRIEFYQGYADPFCNGQMQITKMICGSASTGINNVDKDMKLIIYPNPATDHIIIEFSNQNILINYSVKITNTLGQILLNMPLNSLSTNVNLNNLNNGVYFVNIIDTNGSIIDIKKIVLQ